MYFTGLHHDSSPYNGYDYYGERYTVSTIRARNRWRTTVFDDAKDCSRVVWVGFEDSTPAEARAEHDKWVKECRSGEFKFDEED